MHVERTGMDYETFRRTHPELDEEFYQESARQGEDFVQCNLLFDRDTNRIPYSKLVWLKYEGQEEYWLVRKTKVGEGRVETVWHGRGPHVFYVVVYEGENPLLSQSMVAIRESEALALHEQKVAELKVRLKERQG